MKIAIFLIIVGISSCFVDGNPVSGIIQRPAGKYNEIPLTISGTDPEQKNPELLNEAFEVMKTLDG